MDRITTAAGVHAHKLPRPSGRGPAMLAAAMVVLFALPALAADAREPIDDELDKYWNVELAVPTLQNALFIRQGAFEGTLSLGFLPNDSYYLPLPVGVKGAYHMLDTLAIELGFSWLHPFGTPEIDPNDVDAETGNPTKPIGMSDLLHFLETAGKKGLLAGVRRPPRMNWTAGLDLVYSPLHGKVGVFDQKISSFDIGLAAGLGLIGVETDPDPYVDNDMEAQLKVAGHWGATLRFFIKSWLCVRADYRQFVYQPEAEGAVLFPVELTLGVSFLSN